MPTLHRQLFAIRTAAPNRVEVVAVQYWTDLHRGQAAVVFTINGRITSEQSGPPSRVEKLFRGAKARLAADRVESEVALSELAAITGAELPRCAEQKDDKTCGTVLPVAGRFCVRCGTPRPASSPAPVAA